MNVEWQKKMYVKLIACKQNPLNIIRDENHTCDAIHYIFSLSIFIICIKVEITKIVFDLIFL